MSHMIKTDAGLIVPQSALEFSFPGNEQLPAGWSGPQETKFGLAYSRRDGLRVIGSIENQDDGKPWIHVSASFRNSLPKWKDMKQVKELFIGVDRYAYHVIPPKKYYVNLCKYALHLWSRLDGPALPEFSREMGGRRMV